MTVAANPGGSPLAGLRVLELGYSVGAAFCGKLLAEMGLDVVMAEPPSGHPLRRSAPLAPTASGEDASPLFLYLAAGKRSIVVDRGDPGGRARLEELVAGCDLVIHDLPDREAAAQGLDFETLKRIRPGIVVVAVTPFGATGPHADRPATDLTVFALSGTLYLTGEPGREPLLPYGHQPSLYGGLVGASCALASLLRSSDDGASRFVDVSQQEALASSLDTALSGFNYRGTTRARYGNRLESDMPLTDVYRTKDGFFVVCVYTEAQWRGLCAMLERPEWLGDPEFATLAGRRRHAALIEKEMTAWFAARTSREALAGCQLARFPSCIVSSVRDLLDDPQLLARDHFAAVDDADVGRLLYPKLPYRMSSGHSIEARAPRAGEHDVDVVRGWSKRSAAHVPVREDAQALPLEGIRVLDVTHAWAGPFAGMQLGFLGADVIKVEGSSRPDGTRYVSQDPKNPSPAHESGGYFHEWNRNKRSAVVNMDTAEGRDLMHHLARHCDVLINNHSARVLPKWGLDWETLHRLNPRLVLVTMPAFGSQGPYREFVGYGETLEGAGGLTRLSGYEPGKPMRCGTAYSDPLVGHYGALAVNHALMLRQKTGAGVWLDLSHQECVVHMVGSAVLHYQMTGALPEPRGNARADLLLNEVFPCAGTDEWVAISASTPDQLRVLAGLVGTKLPPAMVVTPDMVAAIRNWTAALPKAQAMERLAAADIPAGAVWKIAELFADPHLVARGFFERVSHPVVGEKPHPRAGFRIAGADVATRLHAPLFDSATDDVLREVLGRDGSELAGLRRIGAIGGAPAGSLLPV